MVWWWVLASPAWDGSCACCACLSALFSPADHCMFLRHQNSCVVFMSHVTMSCDVLYVCVYTYLFVIIPLYVPVCVWIPLYLCMCMCIYMYVCILMYTYAFLTSLDISVPLYVCTHLYVDMLCS